MDKNTRLTNRLQSYYESNNTDKHIELLGFRNKDDFEVISKFHRLESKFTNDSFKEGSFDAQFNIIELKNHSDRRLIGLYTVKDEDNELLLRYMDALYQSVVVGRKRGVTNELEREVKKLEAKYNINHREAITEYAYLFSNQRAEIANVNTNLYYNVFAAAIQLTFQNDQINKKEIKQIQKSKIYPLTELNQQTISFFSNYLI
ncbi:hypothetical protein JXA48_03190 [Candidatus Woesearchaeota archaeon]|nr:hypothetical protein [Candidatus Woesearchaeota archaeon]